MSTCSSISPVVEEALLRRIEEVCGLEFVGQDSNPTLKQILDESLYYDFPPLGCRREITQRIQKLKRKSARSYLVYLQSIGVPPFNPQHKSTAFPVTMAVEKDYPEKKKRSSRTTASSTSAASTRSSRARSKKKAYSENEKRGYSISSSEDEGVPSEIPSSPETPPNAKRMQMPETSSKHFQSPSRRGGGTPLKKASTPVRATRGPFRFTADLEYPEDNAMGLILLDSFKNEKITVDGSTRYVAGFIMTFQGINIRDLESERFSMRIIEDDQAIECKCPKIPHDFIHNHASIAAAKQEVDMHSAAVQDELNIARNKLIKDKKRHDHHFILDFRELLLTINEIQIPVILQSFAESKLHPPSQEDVEPELYEFNTDHDPITYHDDAGDEVTENITLNNLAFKVAINEEEPRYINEGADPQKGCKGAYAKYQAKKNQLLDDIQNFGFASLRVSGNPHQQQASQQFAPSPHLAGAATSGVSPTPNIGVPPAPRLPPLPKFNATFMSPRSSTEKAYNKRAKWLSEHRLPARSYDKDTIVDAIEMKGKRAREARLNKGRDGLKTQPQAAVQEPYGPSPATTEEDITPTTSYDAEKDRKADESFINAMAQKGQQIYQEAFAELDDISI